MPTRPPSQNLSLSITNPLILYRALIATRKIKPDPAQHRLALQLQKLYYRLKDYAPEVEYRYRLERIGRSVARNRKPGSEEQQRDGTEQRNPNTSARDEKHEQAGAKKSFSSLLSFNSLPTSTLSLIRTTPLHDSAVAIDSPMGMLLSGEVGRGKSMLLDLLYNSLPSRKKRRWHFNTFMLDIFRRIELGRIERLETSGFANMKTSLFGGPSISDHEHVVLTMAKDTISDSPILFLDEFQMPDRTSSKLINGFFTAFFHLGGVLVASSNRMPEELSKAAGIEFGEMQRRRGTAGGGLWGLGWGLSRASEGDKAAKTDFGLFLEVLRARCEVWEMEGERDWRREGDEPMVADALDLEDEANLEENLDQTPVVTTTTSVVQASSSLSSDAPSHYHISLTSSTDDESSLCTDMRKLNPSDAWQPTTLTVYARKLHLPQTYNGILKASFRDLCASYLGPADYVSLCSTFHTLILTAVPVLTLIQKNEARRFITLLDALYEAKCRLLIEADAPPDKLFFPETRIRSSTSATSKDGVFLSETLIDERGDSITSESFSEMYQDSTAPFRPNVTTYTESNIETSMPPSFTPSVSNPNLRTVLADEDADFGPTYGNGRGYGISNSSTVVHEMTAGGPDFTSTSALTGEDERFAYKRARSRLWEMCGRKWWDERLPDTSATDEEAATAPQWWRPVQRDGRFWEGTAGMHTAVSEIVEHAAMHPDATPSAQAKKPSDDPKVDGMFRHNASPFRRNSEPPPKFGWQHAWGMMQWGKKAGEWGKGVEGRKPGKEGEEQSDVGGERQR